MDFFDSKGWKWHQNADGSWSRWTGSAWVAPDAQYAAPATPGMVGTNQNEYSDKQGFRWAIDANGQHWKWNGSAWLASEASPDYTPPAKTETPTTDPTADPTTDQPVSYDPPAGGPSYTPGIVFGQGQLPGTGQNGQPYQRNWFDVGPDAGSEALNNITYNTPGTGWDLAWQKVMDQFGGMQGGDFNKWLSQFSGTAHREFENTVPYVTGPKGEKGLLNVSDFLDQYAPQLKGVYDLMPGQAKGRGGAMPLAGRSNY